MAVPSNTAQTYNFTTIREDLSDVVSKISPTETPVFTAIGKGTADAVYHEWSTIQLAAANEDNMTVEGDDAVIDAPTAATRLGNYCQLMDKVASVSDTTQAVRSAGNVTKLAYQVMLRTQEIKRDMEKRICSNEPAVAGNGSTARETAGLGCFMITNASRGSGGTAPTLSGSTSGYPNASPGAGTPRAFTETLLKDVIQMCWNEGGQPNLVVVGGFNKRVASTFTGNATRYKEADRKLQAAIDIYESDFGEVRIVADRFTVASQALVLDTDRASVDYLQTMKNSELAKTGHSDKRMVWTEFCVKNDNEKAHGVVAELTTS